MAAQIVKCHAKRETQGSRAITMKNGEPATQGACLKCGTKMFRCAASSSRMMDTACADGW